MKIRLKNKEEIAILKEGGKRHAFILNELAKLIAPGVTGDFLDKKAEEMILEGGDMPAFKNYTPNGAPRPFPASLCLSINDEIVHGIPYGKILKEGDIVTLDLGIRHGGLFTDSAITVAVGKIDKKAEYLITHTKKALYEGIKAAKGGNTVYDIGLAIERYLIGQKINVISELCGHGVGFGVHEDPFVPNYPWEEGKKIVLQPGMVLAIEPITTLGKDKTYLANDNFTYKTKDGSISAQFEHTIVITKGLAEVLTV